MDGLVSGQVARLDQPGEGGDVSVEFIHGSCQPVGRILFRELAGCRSSNTLNLYPTMAIHVPAYFHAIMQRGGAPRE